MKMTGLGLLMTGLVIGWFSLMSAEAEAKAKVALETALLYEDDDLYASIVSLELELEDDGLSDHSPVRAEIEIEFERMKTKYAKQAEPELRKGYEALVELAEEAETVNPVQDKADELFNENPNWLLHETEAGEDILKFRTALLSLTDDAEVNRFVAQLENDTYMALFNDGRAPVVDAFEVDALNQLFARQLVKLQAEEKLADARKAGQAILEREAHDRYREILAKRNDRLANEKPKRWKDAAKSVMNSYAEDEGIDLKWEDEKLIDWTANGFCLIGVDVEQKKGDTEAYKAQQYIVTLRVRGDEINWTKGRATMPIDDYDDPAVQVVARIFNEWPDEDMKETTLDYSKPE